MSRRSVTRAVCAPLAIALVTTAIPPAISNSSAIGHWSAGKLSVALTTTGDGVSRLGESLSTHGQASAGKVIQAREELAAQLSAAANTAVSHVDTTIATVVSRVDATITQATDAVASGTDAALARIDSWMTSVSETVIAMLPSASNESTPVIVASIEAKAPAADEPRPTASLSDVTLAPTVTLPARIDVAPTHSAAPTDLMQADDPTPAVAAEPTLPAPQVAQKESTQEIEQTSLSAPVEKTVVATLGLIETAAAALAPVASAATPAEMKIEAQPTAIAVEAAPVAKAAPEIIPDATPSPAKAEQKLVVASLDHHAATAEAQPAAAPAPVVEIKAKEDQAEEKLIVASLGDQTSSIDASPVSAPASIASFKSVPESSSAAEVPSESHVIDPLQRTNVSMSAPLKIRALTRADIPAAEKLASLGPSTASDARKLAPEEQRVAYDAPVATETPMSIGRRRWTEEAAKYQGLGSPEALLEALKHMGAGAKTLGLPASLWCADFMNLVLRKSGIPATGSRAAKSYLQYGQKINEPRVGAIAIFSRGANGGHIGIVRGTDGRGNPIIVSGNHNHKVAEAVYPKERVLAYVVPR